MAQAPKETADRLFQLPPRHFVAERDLAAAQARALPDPAAAAALAALRRPTVSAWLVNLLALRRPDLVDQLAELAAALRQAQQRLQGEQLRELARQRRAVIEALVAAARSLAREVDPELPAAKLPLGEVEATLSAALADPEVAAQVRAGRLQRAVTSSSFGDAGGSRLRLVPGSAVAEPAAAAAEPAAPAAEDAREQVRMRHQAALAERTAAQAALAAAEDGKQRAAADQRDASATLAQLDERLAQLQAERAEAARGLAQAQAAELAARREVAAARRRVSQAEAEVNALGSSEDEPY